MTARAAERETGGGLGSADPAVWAMTMFILTEAVLFSLLFASYFYIFSGSPQWPPAGEEAPKLLIPFINTGILLSSSVTMIWAEHMAKKHNISLMRTALIVTFILGLAFISLQVNEYVTEKSDLRTDAYASLFFVITGFHGAHVIAGLLMNLYVQALSWTGRLDMRKHIALTNASWYWHFVDVVWIFVLSTCYLSPHILGVSP